MRATCVGGSITHIVRSRSDRGYNGTDYTTLCGLRLFSDEKWASYRSSIPTCIACLGTKEPYGRT